MEWPDIVNERSRLMTERKNPASRELDRLSTLDALDLIQREDVCVHRALHEAREAIARAIDVIADRLARGGRLFYVGAGTSGRLATLDAAECPPTFQSAPEQVQAILAGGPEALTRSVEGAEDDAGAAATELAARKLDARDVVFGIAAGGTTPFVHGALDFARERGAATIFLACVDAEHVPDRADVSIRVLVGPEVLTGSTRLKAGTATKLVLNAVSTLVMTRLGKVYENLMVDVNTRANVKLVDRGVRIVAEVTGLEYERAKELLAAADGEAKTAIAMHRLGCDAPTARKRVAAARGRLRDV
ncbi:MAG: N-acetylmuramic acid 6-phosphate etherase [Planctomycetes bacterium]|nr:N-acetylmuramic acid 6-phosphate etherase [Planctomycetota bacterium]